MSRLTRRELGGLVGGAFLLAACGGSKSGGSSGGAAGGGTTAPAGGALPPITLKGTTVPAGEQISATDSRRYAQLLNGRWLGAWQDSQGRSGQTNVNVRINPMSRTAVMDVDCGGAILLGQSVVPERYTINMAGFSPRADHWNVVSPQVGSIVASAQSGTDFTGTVTQVVQPSIDTIDVTATRVGSRVDLRYQLNPASGSPVHGTMAWAKGSTRAAPADLNAVSNASPANIQSGGYAAGLLSAADVTRAVGKPFGAPTSNGGRLFYANGVDVSDGLVNSTDKSLVVQYSVYVCHTPSDAKKFWKVESANAPSSIHGPWRDAFSLDNTFYAFDGKHVTTVQIVTLHASQSSVKTERAEIAITKALIANLKN